MASFLLWPRITLHPASSNAAVEKQSLNAKTDDRPVRKSAHCFRDLLERAAMAFPDYPREALQYVARFSRRIAAKAISQA
jgi:hypothetical protein